MKRYKLRTLQNSDGSSTDYMVVYPDGEWVEWSNVEKGIELLKTTAKPLNDIEDLRGAVLYQLIIKYLQEIGEGK